MLSIMLSSSAVTERQSNALHADGQSPKADCTDGQQPQLSRVLNATGLDMLHNAELLLWAHLLGHLTCNSPDVPQRQ